MLIRDLFALRRHARHPARRLLPRAGAGQARRRGLRVHHHRRLARGPPESSPRAERHPRAVRPAADGHHRGARQAWRARTAQRVDLRLLRLRQVELRQAPRARPSTASRCRTAARSRRRGCSRDTSPEAAELREAWSALRQKIDPLAVVFDIGGIARDNEHIHAAAVRQVQRRLGYCTRAPRRGLRAAASSATASGLVSRRRHRRCSARRGPSVKDKALAEEDFSLVMSELYPDRYTDPMAWFTSRGGTHARSESPEEAVAAIRDMLKFRRPGATLFLVVDEVSQYVLSNKDRVDRLRAFATAIGATLRGRPGCWRSASRSSTRRRTTPSSSGRRTASRPSSASTSPPRTSGTSSTSASCRSGPTPRDSCARSSSSHRPDLKLYAYGCESVTPEEFVEVYPMLPGQIDLILQITSALRTRSARAQGDDQAIRGLLQLLGELFRDQKLADTAGRRTRDPRPDLRGAAHRARRRRAGLDGPRAEPVRRRRRTGSWCAPPRRWPCLSSSRRPRPPMRSSWRSASTTGSTAATRWPP